MRNEIYLILLDPTNIKKKATKPTWTNQNDIFGFIDFVVGYQMSKYWTENMPTVEKYLLLANRSRVSRFVLKRPSCSTELVKAAFWDIDLRSTL